MFTTVRASGAEHRAGDRLSEHGVSRVVASAAARAGLDGRWSGHSLRRGVATAALDTGIGLDRVRRHLRHRSIESTVGYGQGRAAVDDQPHIALPGPATKDE